MLTAIQPYIDSIVKQGASSWAVLSIFYLVAAIGIRGWFWGPLSSRLKLVEKKTASKINGVYLKHSFLGWLFFLFPIALILIFWNRASMPVPLTDNMLLAIGIASYVLSLIFHLQAFSIAALSIMPAGETPKVRDL